MTREELKQIYYINDEIKMWQRELERMQCQSLVKGQVLTGMPFNTGISDSTGNTAIEMETVREIIKGKLAEIQLQRGKIMHYINSVPDSQMRQIMYFRNVSCMSWNQIAMELGGYNTADCIRKTYDRYFKKDMVKT
ncbi:hypothetical protein [Parasporobacterium paucivorans]|uniref:Phage transcriptional activator, RinA family n=1 Tax=Parasporobacterium paucivorans DSM 15970 TaxID=1122934 RepID=A0A1M6B3E7_9FIRM|nr:hypothetical protein [Parasporobacterium paucivorans]SHI43235.1 hypothetical protein SAMN02745691_00249 [Parasporobacterium paucivorans DSM 15970]